MLWVQVDSSYILRARGGGWDKSSAFIRELLAWLKPWEVLHLPKMTSTFPCIFTIDNASYTKRKVVNNSCVFCFLKWVSSSILSLLCLNAVKIIMLAITSIVIIIIISSIVPYLLKCWNTFICVFIKKKKVHHGNCFGAEPKLEIINVR